jgi:glutamate N-acetyltransferase/amino-acid N-acetyltransferase
VSDTAVELEIEWLEDRGVTAPAGFQIGAERGGIKTQGLDVAILAAVEGSTAAAVFTTNRVKAAPVLVSAEHLSQLIPRAVVVNAGNANCCTGARGIENARCMAELAAEKLGCLPQEVLVCSTGIIGHQLPMNKVEAAILNMKFAAGAEADEAGARAFMTTDIVPKYIAARATIDGKVVTVGGQAKGVGMIGPKMAPLSPPALHATMLSFITTDAQIDRDLLQSLLETSADRAFNSVTVDGDTSTNDTAILMASGESGLVVDGENAEVFLQLLQAVTIRLAQKIARDGEGATKLIEIQVGGAATEADAKQVALTVANSPLVKTAIFGRDPNWGRIAMAAGRAGVEFEPSGLSFSLGGIEMFRNGEPVNFDLATAEAALAEENIVISIQLGQGTAAWTAWTCDFSYDYVKINAEYHT